MSRSLPGHVSTSLLRRAVAVVAAATLVCSGGSAPAVAAPSSAGDVPTAQRSDAASTVEERAGVRTDLRRWSSTRALRNGRREGVTVRQGALRVGDPVGVRRWADAYGGGRSHRYAYGRWTSPWHRTPTTYQELVPSWTAATPAGTWLQVQARVRTAAGRTGGWDVVGRWAGGRLTGWHRTTQGSQRDDVASVATDTVRSERPATRWQLRLTLNRRVGTGRSPVVTAIGATSSGLPPGNVSTSRPGAARGEVLAVPRYSQMTHSGHYPQWGGGGRAWCSPTSVAMLLGAFDRGPRPRQYSWVPDGHRQPWVDHAARLSYDHRYDGTGNWAFSTAYAGTLGMDAFVVRLPSLRAAERYIAAGIPLSLSIAFSAGELDGSPLSSTAGHLLVLRGFTRAGDPVVNDPAAASRSGVRRVYARGQLEDAWLTASAGTAYVVRPRSVALPH
jgi:hypothetical protein